MIRNQKVSRSIHGERLHKHHFFGFFITVALTYNSSQSKLLGAKIVAETREKRKLESSSTQMKRYKNASGEARIKGNFLLLRNHCLEENLLYEDVEFPADDSSIRVKSMNNTILKRPLEIDSKACLSILSSLSFKVYLDLMWCIVRMETAGLWAQRWIGLFTRKLLKK